MTTYKKRVGELEQTPPAQHTPGPWHVNPIGQHCLYVETNAPEMICDMQLDATPYAERPTVQANARLIAQKAKLAELATKLASE